MSWEPAGANEFRSFVGRVLSLPCYPALLPFAVFSTCDATVANARWWRMGFTSMGLLGGTVLHTLVARKMQGKSATWHGLAQVMTFLAFDHPFIWLAGISHQLMKIFSVNRTGNRLNAGKLHGPKVLVVGNGPSAITGPELGDEIDKFDEVVRFNNFQTKVAGMEKHVGTKCTVHFSDGVLYPTYKEYHVPGATVMLSLFVDRFIVAGSYVIMRAGADLQTNLTLTFLKDPKLSWIDKESIERLKKVLGLKGVKHPTSGMLAIDYMLNKEGVQLPVYIHGFDFFMGPKMHYFDDHEPLWERVNDRIGVNMHSPHKEKVYVEKLIAEGKVKFLKDK